jgi:hypothetical protein
MIAADGWNPSDVDPCTDERKALSGEIFDNGRESELAVEPRLDHVVDIRRLRRH